MRALTLLSALLFVVLVGGCGPLGIGSECYYTLDDNGCVDGAFCTPARSAPVAMGQDPTWDTAICRAVCAGAGDCTVAGEECRAVPGAERFSTCQPISSAP